MNKNLHATLQNIEESIGKGKYEQALSGCQDAIKVDPESKVALYDYGFVLYKLGRDEEAIPFFEKALARDPEYEKAIHGLLVTCITTGNHDRAHDICRKMIEKNPNDHFAYHNIASYKKYGSESDEDVKLLRKSLAREDLNEDARIGILFSLAKIYSDLKKYDDAFSYCDEANKLFAKKHPFKDKDYFQKTADSYKKTFTKDFFSERKGFGNNTSLPLFIVGMPRSGTTLVEQILTRNEKIFSKGELSLAADFSGSVQKLLNSNISYPGCLLSASRKFTRNLADLYLSELKKSATGAIFIIDKMPHNFWHLGFISLLFPNAKIIHCKRNVLDTGVSNYFCRYTYGNEFSYSLEGIGCYYKIYDDLIRHWHKNLLSPIHDISYEALVENPEDEIRKLTDFCGLEWGDIYLEQNTKNRQRIETASAWQARQPIYTASSGRWKNYEKHLAPLKKALEE